MDENYQNQQQPYGQQQPLPNAILILVLGILSIIVCQPLGIAAWIMGNKSIDLYNQSPNVYTRGSYSNVQAGRICGIIGVCLMALWIILLIAGVSFLPFMAAFD